MTVPGSVVHMGTQMHAASSVPSLVADYPTGYTAVANDLAVLTVNQTGSNSAITTPSGYTLIKRTERTTTHVQAVYRRKLSAGNTAPTVAVAADSTLNLCLSIWRNVDTTTPEDKVAVSSSGTGPGGYIGPDIGTLVTPCAPIISAGYCDNMGDGSGVMLADDRNIDAFTAIGGVSGQASAASGPGGCAIVFHHNMIPLQTDRTHTHIFVPASGANVTGGWIVTVIALRPADPTVVPVARDLHGAAIQQALPSAGTECSPQDPYNTRLVTQVFNPLDGGGEVWSSGGDGSFWDVAQWAGPGRWQDLTTRTRGVEWKNGADQPGGRPRIATATIELDNADGLVSPWATTGTFTDGVESWLRTGALCRICFTSTSTDLSVSYGRSIFTGEIETIDEDTEATADAWVVLSVVDTLARLATYNGVEQVEQGGGETLYVRLLRLLNDAGYPYLYAIVPAAIPAHATAATFTATTLAGERLGELYLLGDSAGVHIYCGPNGNALLNNPLSAASTRTFSNKPAGAQLPMVSARPYANNQRILNVAIAARVDGHEVEIQNGPSVSKFGRIDTGNGWPRRDLICQSDLTIAAILNDVLAFRATDDQGVEQIVVDADSAPTSLFNHLAFMRLFENVDVRYVHPTLQSLEYTQHSYIEAMAHKVTRQGYQTKWVTTINLAKYPA